MDSLRIDNGIRRIQVNDDGEYIEFSVSDNNFYKNFSKLIRWFEEQKRRPEIKTMEEQKNKVVPNGGGSVNLDAFDNVVDIRGAIIQEACEKVDDIFGKEACRKIFGNVTPDLFMIAEFLEAVKPFIDKYVKERNQAVNKKYSKNRKGAKS